MLNTSARITLDAMGLPKVEHHHRTLNESSTETFGNRNLHSSHKHIQIRTRKAPSGKPLIFATLKHLIFSLHMHAKELPTFQQSSITPTSRNFYIFLFMHLKRKARQAKQIHSTNWGRRPAHSSAKLSWHKTKYALHEKSWKWTITISGLSILGHLSLSTWFCICDCFTDSAVEVPFPLASGPRIDLHTESEELPLCPCLCLPLH